MRGFYLGIIIALFCACSSPVSQEPLEVSQSPVVEKSTDLAVTTLTVELSSRQYYDVYMYFKTGKVGASINIGAAELADSSVTFYSTNGTDFVRLMLLKPGH